MSPGSRHGASVNDPTHQQSGAPSAAVLGARELAAGCLAGAANVASGFPLDTIKVRLQSAPPGHYSGLLHCARSVLRHEGVRGLYRGLTPPLIGGAAETGVNYLVYSRLLDVLTASHGGSDAGPLPARGAGHADERGSSTSGSSSSSSAWTDLTAAGSAINAQHLVSSTAHAPAALAPAAAAAANDAPLPPTPPPLACVALAGAAAGVALSFILGPTELVKVVRAEGLRGLCRGLGATMCREVPGNALFFTVYEALRRTLLTSTSAATATAASPQQAPAWELEGAALGGSALHPVALAEAASSSSGSSSSTYGVDDAAALRATAPSHPLQPPPPQSAAPVAALSTDAPPEPCSSAAVPDPGAGAGPGQAAAPTSQSLRNVLAEAGGAIFCGGAAGTIMWATVLPIDVAKTRLQTAQPGTQWDVPLRTHFAMLWREGGLRALYSGLSPTLVRAFPANACQWLAWELAMRGLPGGGGGGGK